VFWSKIWFFLVAIAAAVALTLALLMPRPAERSRVAEERQRLVVACDVVSILLAENARTRVELAGVFARAPEVVTALGRASEAREIGAEESRSARDAGTRLIAAVKGARPDFAALVDRRGRVLARVGIDEGDFGDLWTGRPLVDDALAGYLRDDLWVAKDRLFLVSASPVVRRDAPAGYVGAVVLGHAVTKELSDKLVGSLDVQIGFYIGESSVASSSSEVLDEDALLAAVPAPGVEMGGDCARNDPFNLTAGKEDYTAVVARLPGEAQARRAFYTVFIERPKTIGFAGTLGAVTKSDLSFGNFPWLLVGIGLIVALGAGMALMILEHDRPLKRFAADGVRLAKGESERLAEDAHRGKLGSVARSVNIAIDKLQREAKAARKDLDQLLGPAPEGSLGAIDLVGAGLPPVRTAASQPAFAPPAAFAPPPPSEFRFGDPPRAASPARGGASGAIPVNAPISGPLGRPSDLDLPSPSMSAPPMAVKPAARPTPPPIAPPARTPPPRPAAPPPGPPPRSGRAIDEDILSVDEPAEPTSVGAEPGSLDEDASFRSVYDQFLELKAKCGEPTGGVTFAKFSDKLRRNRDELRAKTGCKQVKFTVYVKDGKAALKATPVKEA
jgi:hypothetical protein